MIWIARLRPHAARLVVIGGLAAVNGLLPAVAVALVDRVVASITDGRPDGGALGVLVGLAVLAPALQVGRAALSRRLSWHLVHELRLELHDALHRRPRTTSAGDRVAALLQETEALNVVVSAAVTAVRAPLTTLSLLVGAAVLAPTLAWRVAVLAPLVVLVAWTGGRLVGTWSRHWRQEQAILTAEATDQQNGLQTTLDHGAVSLQKSRLATVSARESRERAFLEWAKTTPGALVQTLVLLAAVHLAWTAGNGITAGTLEPGPVAAFFTALVLLRAPLVKCTGLWSTWHRASATLERVAHLLAEEPSADAMNEGDLRFSSRGLPGRIDPLELEVAPGTKLAVVGASGSGKSTVLSLLADGCQVIHCRQDPWIFDRTLMQNLRLARPSLTPQEARALLAFVHLDDLWPRRDERVGEKGRSLSGGQRQRLALARALALPDRPLLLDESTSEVEADLARSLAERLVSLDRTIVFATHDPWFPRLADEVLWLERGAVRGRGPHAELLHDPAYSALWPRSAA